MLPARVPRKPEDRLRDRTWCRPYAVKYTVRLGPAGSQYAALGPGNFELLPTPSSGPDTLDPSPARGLTNQPRLSGVGSSVA